MLAKVQILRDDGTVIFEQVGNAFSFFSWEPAPYLKPLEGTRKFPGFTFLPAPPPPRDPEDLAEFRRLYAEHVEPDAPSFTGPVGCGKPD